MIIYNDTDLEQYPLFKSILIKLGGEEVTEKDVWDEARGFLYPPSFEDILMKLTAKEIEPLIADKFGDLDIEYDFKYEVNGNASWVTFNGSSIESSADMLQAITINGGSI